MRKRAASLERINDAPLTRHEKLAKVSLGVEQFAGAWERRLAQQRSGCRPAGGARADGRRD